MQNIIKKYLYPILVSSSCVALCACDGDSDSIMDWGTPTSSSSGMSHSNSSSSSSSASSSASSSSGMTSINNFFHENRNADLNGNIANGGAEQGLEHWFILPSSPIIDSAAGEANYDHLALESNGEQYIKGTNSILFGSTEYATERLALALYNIEQNTEYEVSAWVRTAPVSSEDLDISLSVVEYDAGANGLNDKMNASDSPEQAWVTTTNTWQQISFRFVTDNQEAAWAVAFATTNDQGSFLIDDVTIRDISEEVLCTTVEIPALKIIINDSNPNQTNNLCLAQVTATNENNATYYLAAEENQSDDSQCIFVGAPEAAGTYNVNVNVQGYSPVLLEGVVAYADICHVITAEEEIELTPAATNCHDGYSWTNDQCETLNACVFPQYDQTTLPGVQQIDPETGEDITQIHHDCVDTCMGYFYNPNGPLSLPESPGVCPTIALP